MQVVWDLTRNDVLVMEYVPGKSKVYLFYWYKSTDTDANARLPGLMRLTEPEVLEGCGLELTKCGELVSDALTELALVHGHVVLNLLALLLPKYKF